MDIFALGQEIGKLHGRVDRNERRIGKLEKKQAHRSHVERRIILLLLLWTLILIGVSSTDKAADLLAAILQKLLT